MTRGLGDADQRDSVARIARNELKALSLWERFHVRLTFLYGGAVLVGLTAIIGSASALMVRSEMRALKLRILGVAQVEAMGLDADAIASVPVEGPSPVHDQVGAYLEGVLASSPDLESTYVLLVTDQPAQFRFFQDRSHSLQGTPGEPYDATDVPRMLDGLSAPAVEDELVSDEFGTTLSGYAPLVRDDGTTIGIVGVDVDAEEVQAVRHRVLELAAVTYAATVALLGLVTWLVARMLREPLVQMIAASASISRGFLGTRLGLSRRDEFGVLARHFDQMAAGLEEREFIRATFGRYMSEDVARALLANPDAIKPGGEEREVTILFSDIRGYSTIAEHLEPSQVVLVLNSYLAAMNSVIDTHGGCVIEFLGDAILAVFGAPMDLPGHPERAVRCALEMREALDRQNEAWEKSGLARLWQERGLKHLSQRVGVHSGRVVAGNLGSSQRMKYAVIGDAVNVAARLESLNKELDTTLLMSDAVFCELPDDLARAATCRGEHHVKGRDQPVVVWSI